MFRLLAFLLFAAAVVAANPFVVTYLNEVSTDPSHQFVELHAGPRHELDDLSGWQMVTSMSTCTLSCVFQDSEFFVVDSAALGVGQVGHGKLRLNPLGDSVSLVDTFSHIQDQVHFPRYPTGYKRAPLPPATGGIALWDYDDFEDQSVNWYIDSTPTPGRENDDYSMIAGTVIGTGGVTLDEVYVAADGQNGHCHRGLNQQSGYTIGGLGAGTYQVSAWVCHNGHEYGTFYYPDSVSVGYNGTVGGIDFAIPLAGVAEIPSVPVLPTLRASGRSLLLSGDGTAPVNVQLYNQVGSRVSEFHLGPINGEKRVELPATLAPGIYFATAQKGISRSNVKVVLW